MVSCLQVVLILSALFVGVCVGCIPGEQGEKPDIPTLTADEDWQTMKTDYVPDDESHLEHNDVTKCGKSLITLGIVGGHTTLEHEFPWQVKLVHTGARRMFCGGAIIGSSWVLTAAHCVTDLNEASISITAGDHDRSLVEVNQTNYAVKKIYAHTGYSDRTLVNDIALIQVCGGFAKNRAVQAICLPASTPKHGTAMFATGWGTLQSNGYMPRDLQVVKLRKSMCSGMKTEKNMCAGAKGKDTCQGDSGGPLFSNYTGPTEEEATSTHTIYGITSFGQGCGRMAGYYTKVDKYVTWIKNIMQKGGNVGDCPNPR